MRSRCPTDVTPSSARSSRDSARSASPSMWLAAKAAAYGARPRRSSHRPTASTLHVSIGGVPAAAPAGCCCAGAPSPAPGGGC
eukprot:2937503-Prymnesium_polylepis.1